MPQDPDSMPYANNNGLKSPASVTPVHRPTSPLPARRRDRPDSFPNDKDERHPKDGEPGLLYWEDAPKVLQFNRFIRSGYRAGYSYAACIGSVFSYHNETGNIWSHLLPALLLTLVAVTGIDFTWPNASIPYALNVITTCMCLALSVCYHTFMGCHKNYGLWITFDVLGVYAARLGSEYIMIEWGLPCHPEARMAAIVAAYGVGIVGMGFSVVGKSAKSRGLPMLAMTLVDIMILAFRGSVGTGSKQALRFYWASEAVAIVGGMVNVCRVPERWFQPVGKRKRGVFDYWGNSHQLMHVCVAIGLMWLHHGIGLDAKESFREGVVCPVAG